MRLEERLPADKVIGDTVKLFVLAINQDESSIEIPEVDHRRHVVYHRLEACRLRPSALYDSTELCTDGFHQLQHCFVGFHRLRGKELEHRDDVVSHQHRECEAGLDPDILRKLRSSKGRILSDVHDPGRFSGSTGLAGQARPGLKSM